MDKKQILDLLYAYELKELAHSNELKQVTPTTTREQDITTLQKALTVKVLLEKLPELLKRRSRKKTPGVSTGYLLTLLFNYELEKIARTKGVLTGPLTTTNRDLACKKLIEKLSVPELKRELETQLKSRGRVSVLPSKNVVTVQNCIYRVLEQHPSDLGAYELEKILCDELPKSILDKGQRFELESNLHLKEGLEEQFMVEYGGFSYRPSFCYGSELVIDVKFFAGMDERNLVPLFLGTGKIYRKSFRETILLIYPPGTMKLDAQDLESLNSENIYIVN